MSKFDLFFTPDGANIKVNASIRNGLYRFTMLLACLVAIGLGGFGCVSVQNEAAIKNAALNEFKQTPTYPPVVLTENTQDSLQELAHMTCLVNTWNFGGWIRGR